MTLSNINNAAFLSLTVNGAHHQVPCESLRKAENFEAICAATRHESIDIAIGASIVLGYLQDERALPYLFHAFLTTVARKAQAVSWALGEIGDESALPFLTEALLSHFVPKSAIVALGKIGSKSSVEILLKFLGDKDANLRALSAKSLGQIKFLNDQELIKKTLSSLKMQLKIENVRAVRLTICTVSGRLQEALEKGRV